MLLIYLKDKFKTIFKENQYNAENLSIGLSCINDFPKRHQTLIQQSNVLKLNRFMSNQMTIKPNYLIIS